MSKVDFIVHGLLLKNGHFTRIFDGCPGSYPPAVTSKHREDKTDPAQDKLI